MSGKPELSGPARLMRYWDLLEQTLVGLLGLCALLVALWQVIGRYADPANAISYAEEVIVYFIIWAIMITSSQLVRMDGHVRPDLVLRLLKPQTQRWVEVFNCIFALVFSAGMVDYGWQIVSASLLLDERSPSDLQFPMWIYYLAMPVGGALMVVRYLIRLSRYVFQFDPQTMSVGHTALATEMPLDAQPLDISPQD